MESIDQGPELKKPSPFQNLFLARGYYTGFNHPMSYIWGALLCIMGYFIWQFVMLAIFYMCALSNGVSQAEILAHPEKLMSASFIGMNKSLFLAIIIGMFVCALAFLRFGLLRFHHKTLTSVITGYERIRWKRYFFAFGVWGVLIAGIQVLGYVLDPGSVEINFDAKRFALLVLVAVIFIPIQTATEEIFFRGYLMQGLGLASRSGIFPLIITSVLFALVHSQNPETDAFGFWVMMPYYMLFALFLGFLTLLDEGLELAMGIHCANNLVSGLMVTSKNSVLQTDALFIAKTEDPSSEILLWLILAAVCFTVLWLRYRWKNWKLVLR